MAQNEQHAEACRQYQEQTKKEKNRYTHKQTNRYAY